MNKHIVKHIVGFCWCSVPKVGWLVGWLVGCLADLSFKLRGRKHLAYAMWSLPVIHPCLAATKGSKEGPPCERRSCSQGFLDWAEYPKACPFGPLPLARSTPAQK